MYYYSAVSIWFMQIVSLGLVSLHPTFLLSSIVEAHLAFFPKLPKRMDDHQIKMGFSVDRKERGIKITQFSYTEPYEIVIFVS